LVEIDNECFARRNATLTAFSRRRHQYSAEFLSLSGLRPQPTRRRRTS